MPKEQPFKRRRVVPDASPESPSASGSDSDSEAPEELQSHRNRPQKQQRGPKPASARQDVIHGGGSDDEEDEPATSDSEQGASDSDEDGSGGGSEESGSGDERTLEEQVADVPFETLVALRQDGRGLVGRAARTLAAREDARHFKRGNKDRPQEVSSKRPVGRFREVIQVPHSEVRDPRFDSAPSAGAAKSGPGGGDPARHRYAFLFNDVLPREKADLAAKIKKEKNPKFKARLQAQLQRVNNALREEDLKRRTETLEKEWKNKEKSAVSAGKTPFFLKASDKKRLALLAKYQELKEHGKLDKFMEKRRKKNASKDHRFLPSGRREQD